MTKASEIEYTQLSDDVINKIITIISEMDYTTAELEDRVFPYLAQWLFNQGVAIESTCLIISEFTDVKILENTIEGIYNELIPPYSLSELSNFLTDEEYDNLIGISLSDELKTPIAYNVDFKTKIVTNFEQKSVSIIKEATKKGADDTITTVIDAVPKRLIVYDSPFLGLPRTFKITWTSHFSNRNFTTSGGTQGATIPEISNYLIDAGFVMSKKFLNETVTAMINSMIYADQAEIQTSIDNKGIYYNTDNDKLLVVKLDTTEPSFDEMKDAIYLLEELKEFFKDNPKTFATVFKWGIMSVFSYAMKQSGNWLPWLYLKGTAGSGKTTLAKLILYIYGEPTVTNNISGASFNTEYRFGKAVSQECTARVVNEPAAVFKREATKEMVKHCVESLIAREIKGDIVPAFSPVIFTANQYLPNDDALYRRMYVIGFSYSQRKSEKQKREFENTFHINSPSHSKLKGLSVFGRYAVREILSNPSLLSDEWKDVVDGILTRFYSDALVEKPDWLSEWAETENLDDFDNSQIEEIRSFFVNQFNNVRNKLDVKDDYGNKVTKTLDQYEVSTAADFEKVTWDIVNNHLLVWAMPHVSRWGDRSVCFNRSLKKELEKELEFNTDLKSISELLNWEYKSVKIDRKPRRVMLCDFDTFMEFLYPSIGDFDE